MNFTSEVQFKVIPRIYVILFPFVILITIIDYDFVSASQLCNYDSLNALVLVDVTYLFGLPSRYYHRERDFGIVFYCYWRVSLSKIKFKFIYISDRLNWIPIIIYQYYIADGVDTFWLDVNQRCCCWISFTEIKTSVFY